MPRHDDDDATVRPAGPDPLALWYRRRWPADADRQSLSFQPHKVNFEGGVPVSLRLADVERAEAGGRPFELLITTRHGGQERFAVYKRSAWVADITARRPV